MERIIKLVIDLETYRDERHGDEICNAFMEEFFVILLYSSDASNKVVQF